MIFPARSDLRAASVSVGGALRVWPNRYDLIVFAVFAAIAVSIFRGAGEMGSPLAQLNLTPVTLDPWSLPGYALRTTLRMFAAILASLLFTLVVGALAAKSRKAELVIIPALDILQSVPVLGFLTFTVVFFMSLFPGSELGAELAAIFAIFTSQAWNMAFSFYQSLVTVPRDLEEACRHFRLSPWLRFWRLEAPFATPGLVWNTMMSMSGGWFFVVASEAITVGDTKIMLPGIGSYLALAIEKRDIAAVGAAVSAMAIVILMYDQLIFRPVVAWADKCRFEATAAQARPQSWAYYIIRRTRLLKQIVAAIAQVRNVLPRVPTSLAQVWPQTWTALAQSERWTRLSDQLWLVAVLAIVAWSLWTIVSYIRATLGLGDVQEACKAGVLTMIRVVVLIALASLVWVPIGVWIGLRPWAAERVQPAAQFLAAFPANVLFPFFVVGIAAWHLDPNIWLSPLMVLGTQWYILFNVIAGASAFPTDLREAATLYRLGSWQWWRQVILPGILPYYVTGALTASGGSWNASIVAEVASWGDTKLEATGLGAYIANATEAGDYHRVVLGIAVMSCFVLLLNRVLWRRLYAYAGRKFRLD
jgi:NitT/TauT family transport system permease protein